MTQRVLVDVNVLSSRILTDWLFHLRNCNRGMFSILWTLDIQAEAIHAMRKKHPEWSESAIERRFRMMEALIDDTGLDPPDGDYSFSGADLGDFHVHAAAVEGNVHYVLNDNQSEDFTSHPDEEPYEIINCDDFLQSRRRFQPARIRRRGGRPIWRVSDSLCAGVWFTSNLRIGRGPVGKGLFPPLRYTFCGVMR